MIVDGERHYFSESDFKPGHLKRAENLISHLEPILEALPYPEVHKRLLYILGDRERDRLLNRYQKMDMTEVDQYELSRKLDEFDILSAQITQVAMSVKANNVRILNQLAHTIEQLGHTWGAEPNDDSVYVFQADQSDSLSWTLYGELTFINQYDL